MVFKYVTVLVTNDGRREREIDRRFGVTAAVRQML